MKTIKVIDLLNKIANKEEVPKIIKYDLQTYYFRNYDYKEYNIEKDYIDEQTSFIEDRFDFFKINDEVEIIEEEIKTDKKIEKISTELHDIQGDCYILENDFRYYTATIIINKINELIDIVNEMKSNV